MKLRAVLIAAALLATSNMASAQKPEDVAETIELFKTIPQVAPYFSSSYGYAVWPRIGRGGYDKTNDSVISFVRPRCRRQISSIRCSSDPKRSRFHRCPVSRS